MNNKITYGNMKYRLIIKITNFIQIIGGALGLLLISYLLLHTDVINGPTLFIFLFGISLFLFSIYYGKKFLFDVDK